MRRFVMLVPLLLIPGSVAVASATPPTPSVAQDTLVGTVRSVDYQTNTVEVITGVGFALRIERVQVGPSVPVTIEGQLRPLDALRRGQVVEVAYRETDRGKVATSLDVMPVRSSGGAP